MPNSHNWSSASASSETACCRIDWRPSRILCGALIAFGLLAGLSLLASDLRPLFAWPAAMAAVGWGAWLARRERRRAPIRLTWRADGLLFVDGGPSTTGTVGKLRMKGREVFRHAVVNLAEVLNEVLADVGLTAADIDWVVPHQANARILDATAKKLGLPPEKVVVTVDRHANTSAASVPLALDTAVRDGRIKRGDVVVLEAMGGGFTWGAAALRY